MVRVRFAPSPTGFLHVGGARTALFNYLFAKQQGGQFILRIDDTDLERSEKRFEDDILESMAWLGLEWNEGIARGGDYGPYRQSEKTARYQEVGNILLDSGKASYDDEGVLRLNYPGTKVGMVDLVCGPVEFSTDALGTPPALLRSDGSPTYHLASVVDDVDMKITHIVRGQDHLTNTAKHLLLMEALGHTPPQFAHLPLILGEDGSKLSKRNSAGMVSVCDFRREGYLPQALINFLVLLGWSHPEGRELLDMEECIARFDFSRVGSTGSVFDTNKLNFLNGHWIRTLETSIIAEASLPFTGELKELISGKSPDYWKQVIEALRSGFATLRDSESLARLLLVEEISLAPEVNSYLQEGDNQEKFLSIASSWQNLIKSSEFNADRDCLTEEDFNQCLSALKRENKKDKTLLFKSLRICVTGSLSGYELKSLIPFISRDILAERTDRVISMVRSW